MGYSYPAYVKPSLVVSKLTSPVFHHVTSLATEYKFKLKSTELKSSYKNHTLRTVGSIKARSLLLFATCGHIKVHRNGLTRRNAFEFKKCILALKYPPTESESNHVTSLRE